MASRYAAPADRSPKMISIERHLIVGRLMDFQVSVDAALMDCDVAIQYASGAAIEPRAVDAVRVLREQRQTLRGLQEQLWDYTGAMDGVSPQGAA